MRNVIAAAGVAASLLVPSAAFAAAPEDADAAPRQVSIEVASVNGSGCPNGRASVLLSEDRESFLLTAPAYFAVAGAEVEPTDFRKNCQFSIQVNKPERWTYAVGRVESSGFAYLGRNATGVSRVGLYFQGMSETTDLTTEFDGPSSDVWKTRDRVDNLVFEPCDAERNLNVNTEVRVTPTTSGRSTNLMVRDPETRFELIWRRC